MLTYGSVCSGIEAVTVAMKPHGWKAAWFAEIEPFPCAVLAHHYPETPNLGDMTKIAAQIRSGVVAAPDVLVGGTPCQAFSIAGLRAGLEDARGQLTLSFVDLADAIDSARHVLGQPESIVWWENVPGVLSSTDNAFGCFLAALAGEVRELQPPGGAWKNAGCVFGPVRTVAWRVLDAQYFGVAQRRRRVFVVASARKGFDPVTVLFESDGMRRDSAPSREAGEGPAGTLASRTDGGGFPGADEACSGYVQPVTSTLDASYGRLQGCSGQDANHGHSHLVPMSVALRGRDGGAAAEFGDDIAGCLRASNGGGDKAHVLAPIVFGTTQITSKGNFSNPKQGDACHPLAAGAHPPAIAFDCKASGQSGFGVGEIASTMRSMNSAQSHANGGGHLAVCIRTANTGANGHGISPELAHTLDRAQGQAVCVTGEVAHTLKAEGFDASEDGTGRGQPIVTTAYTTKLHNTQSNQAGKVYEEYACGLQANSPPPALLTPMAVRRLTPRECERLQAFPDDYTLIPYGRVVKMEKLERDWIKYLLRGGVMTLGQVCQAAADGPRYKSLGNSMCVRNMRWIGLRIAAQVRASLSLERAA